MRIKYDSPQPRTSDLQETGSPGAGIQVSVIVPALNEARVIARCLEALTRQTLPSAAFEVILVDNGSTDDTIRIARGFEKSLNLQVIEKSGVNISALRNRGAVAAVGTFLAFLDADCIAPPHWLSQAVDRLHADGARVVGAHYTIPPGSSWLAKTWYADLRTVKQGPVSYVPAGCLLVSRATFFEIGGFDKTIETCEDCEFCERADEAGFSVQAFPDLSVVHLGTPQTVGGFYRKQLWHGTDVHSVFLRNMRYSSTARSTVFALYTLCCVAALAAGATVAVFSGMYAGVVGPAVMLLAGLLAPAIRAAVQRKRWGVWAPLTVLYFVYGLARAQCLVGISGPRGARPAPAADPSEVFAHGRRIDLVSSPQDGGSE